VNLREYPSAAAILEHAIKPVCSEHLGIARGLLQNPVRYSDDFAIRSLGVPMPPYHKVLLDPRVEMQYHLSGYGVLYEEALIRLAGEVVERYALIVAQRALLDEIQFHTYEEAARKGTVVPFEYLRLFDEADYERLNAGQYHGIRQLERTDTIGWISCPSLFRPGDEILVPAQMLFVGYKANRERNEVTFAPGFSTGTASHTSAEQALLSALLEFVEIDALMLHWYTQRAAPVVLVDQPTVPTLLPKLYSRDGGYDVFSLDLRVLDGVDAHVIASILSNKEDARPLLIFGAQGHLDPTRALYRSVAEAIAVSFLGIYGPIYLPNEYAGENGRANDFTDLDRNVSFFAGAERAAEKRDLVRSLFGGRRPLSGMASYDSGDTRADLRRLLSQLSAFSEYGVYLDITPPETIDRGWKVLRVFIPELLTMCVPGVPYSRHPRLIAHGGVRNRYPHPLP
jgi:thiazole/oxazole-forming peptide maturase SagD family component